MTILRQIVEQYPEEAAFLWLQRDRAVGSPHFSRKDIAKLDGRVEANLDGLRVAGDDGWKLTLDQLVAHSEPGEVFVAGLLAFESGLAVRIDVLRKAVEAAHANSRALVSALGWLPAAIASERIKPWLASEVPAMRRVAVASHAIHRHDLGPTFQRLLEDADAGVRARSLRAAGEMGAGTHLAALRKNFQHPDPACRFWACWSAARLGDRGATAELQLITQAEGRFRGRAISVCLRQMDPAVVHRWLPTLAMLPGGARFAIQGSGRFGDPVAVPHLLESMKDPQFARPAGEAFTFITGVDLDFEDLSTTKPEGFEAGPTEDPADEKVAMDPDENLPWPDLAKVSKWWEKNQSNFRPGQRLLLGKPITTEWLREVLRIGKQRQRAAAALELGLREPNKPLFEVRAPGFRQ